LEWLDGWEADYPADEEIIALRMLTLHRSGRHADAEACYQRACRRLRDVLGVAPGGELLAAHRRLRNRDSAAGPAAGSLARSLAGPAVSEGERGAAQVVPRQLPPPVSGFTARRWELAGLDRLLDESDPRRPAARIQILSGMPGVGKTALAVHWAHLVAKRFPDGHLYADMRGFDAASAPLDPGGVLRGFVEAVGVPPQRIPGSLDGRLGMYRSVLAGKRVLVLLDNVRDADQVRPLLPGSPGCDGGFIHALAGRADE
jgi:hypothetical protein